MTRKEKIRILVKNILNQNKEKADKILQHIIAEAEEERQEQARDEAEEELGIEADQEQTSTDETNEDQMSEQEQDLFADDQEGEEDDQDEFTDIDDEGEAGQEDQGTDEFGPESEQEQLANDSEVNELVDKQVNFECQINNLVLNDLINQVADLKTALENDATLDKHSREFYEIKVPLQYYSETLLKIQKNITPLVNQDEIKKQLDEIKISLQELSSKISGDTGVEQISSPNQIIERDLKPEF